MKKNTIRQYWYLIVLALLALTLLMFKIMIGNEKPNTITPTPTPLTVIPTPTVINAYPTVIQNIVQTKEELIVNLGQPISITKDAYSTNLIYEYRGAKPNWPDQYYYNPTTNRIDLTKTYFPEQTYLDYVSIYGSPTGKYYTPNNPEVYPLYSFAPKGKAIIANKETGIVLAVWSFEPTTEALFKETHRNYLSDKPLTQF